MWGKQIWGPFTATFGGTAISVGRPALTRSGVAKKETWMFTHRTFQYTTKQQNLADPCGKYNLM